MSIIVIFLFSLLFIQISCILSYIILSFDKFKWNCFEKYLDRLDFKRRKT